MPLPKPDDNKKEKDFVQRFMSNDETISEYLDKDQRLAVAHNIYKGGNSKSRDHPNQKDGENLNVEHKTLSLDIIEVKQEGDKGYFKAYLNTYNDVDLGNDLTLKSFGDMNVGKQVYLLKQHTQGTEHGELILGSDEKGVMISGKLFLEHDDKGNQVFPEAHRTYSLLLNGKSGGVPVQFSMGYRVTDYEYKTINGAKVRVLKQGYIMEGSIVTFAMNPNSIQTNEVKKIPEGGEKPVENEEKGMPMSMEQRMAMEDYGRKMNEMPYMFNRSCKECMMNDEMNMMQKQAYMQEQAMYFTQKMMEYTKAIMAPMHDENGMMKKDSDLEVEIKSIEDEFKIEVKEEKAKMDPIKYGKMASKMMAKAVGYMKKAGMYDPEMQMDPEKQKNPEGKDNDSALEIKTLFEGLSLEKNKDGEK